MAAAGYDLFFREPGSLAACQCLICGTACAVERNVFGPTSLAQAQAGQGQWHDRFACPRSAETWHRQAEGLLFELETAGPHCRPILAAELDALLRRAGVRA